ncbi:unnamed protein product [Brassica rapa]|uniref:Uncharacterized protein n=2 Tax=Brassica TaxID=3705 RepID=A0A8D9CW32_BRACM|nr:unnamed protein product [Brassica napus]CAG7864752.1 unnamed protein product [Brassica rapa]CAG7864756.1 unnamed protein product [Brassica rapa]
MSSLKGDNINTVTNWLQWKTKFKDAQFCWTNRLSNTHRQPCKARNPFTIIFSFL